MYNKFYDVVTQIKELYPELEIKLVNRSGRTKWACYNSKSKIILIKLSVTKKQAELLNVEINELLISVLLHEVGHHIDHENRVVTRYTLFDYFKNEVLASCNGYLLSKELNIPNIRLIYCGLYYLNKCTDYVYGIDNNAAYTLESNLDKFGIKHAYEYIYSYKQYGNKAA